MTQDLRGEVLSEGSFEWPIAPSTRLSLSNVLICARDFSRCPRRGRVSPAWRFITFYDL